jgi:hypothetical protein
MDLRVAVRAIAGRRRSWYRVAAYTYTYTASRDFSLEAGVCRGGGSVAEGEGGWSERQRRTEEPKNRRGREKERERESEVSGALIKD